MQKLFSFSLLCIYTVYSVASAPIGLSNEGNTCYMNAALQCLYAIEPLTQYILAPGYTHYYRAFEYNNKKNALHKTVAAEYKELITAVQKAESKSVVNTRLFCEKMWQAMQATKFAQEDSMLFIRILLDHLVDTDIKRIFIKKFYGFPFNNIPKSKPRELFNFRSKVTSACSVCNTNGVENTLDLHISLPLAGKTLKECLDAYFAQEKLNPEDYKRCAKCKKKTPGTRHIKLLEAPEFLIVHLKRFKFDVETLVPQKLDNNIKIPLRQLDLRSYFDETVKVNNTTYDLVSFIDHSGSYGGGHYTCCVYNTFLNQWYWCSDDSIVPVPTANIETLEKIGSQRAYILFYRNRAAPERLDLLPVNEVELGDTLLKSNITDELLVDYLKTHKVKFVDLYNGIKEQLITPKGIIERIQDYIYKKDTLLQSATSASKHSAIIETLLKKGSS